MKHWTVSRILQFIAIFMLLNREQVESRLNYGYFDTKENKLAKIKEAFVNRFKSFQDQLLLDQKIKHEQDMENKRNEIFRKHLLSRVSGTILKDFFNRS